MRVAFLYNRAKEDPAGYVEDDVPSRSPVVLALKELGHTVLPVACTLDLAAVRRRLVRTKPDVVFNRVESLGGSDALMAAVTLLLDAMQIPYTGNSSAALTATASKVGVKRRLVAAGLPTPTWVGASPKDDSAAENPQSAARLCSPKSIGNPKFIFKSVYEHASFQMNGGSVVSSSSIKEIRQGLREREALTGRVHFAEEFVEGREFNLSLIGRPTKRDDRAPCAGPQVLPPAEIDFSALSEGKEHIVGCNAKCNATSIEFLHTPRRFNFQMSDTRLLDTLSDLAIQCWQIFELQGYARVDFRVDPAGRPWILEINSNPCILPDAGFSAALERAGYSYDDGIDLILQLANAQPRATRKSKVSPAPVLNRSDHFTARK
jgi:D-alanine-D-alanine ligase